MRHILFVVCFTTGVGLMILSGYVPKSASAQGTDEVTPVPEPNATVREDYRPPRGRRPRPAVTRRGLRYPAEPVTHRDPNGGDSAEASYAARDWDTERELNDAPAAAYQDDPNAAVANPNGEVADNIAAALEGLDEDPNAISADEAGFDLPAADAGQGEVVWIGWDELRLDGRGSDGVDLTYAWRQVAGPAQLEIADPDRPLTKATGLPVGRSMGWEPLLFTFELRVTDADGVYDAATVDYVVITGPELEIEPVAQRRFEPRDGYVLAHYEAWTTNLETNASDFVIKSPVRLTFTPVSGGEYQLRHKSRSGKHTYTVTVYYPEGASSSLMEFLADTEEKVPVIIQLGVSWDGSYASRAKVGEKKKEATP